AHARLRRLGSGTTGAGNPRQRLVHLSGKERNHLFPGTRAQTGDGRRHAGLFAVAADARRGLVMSGTLTVLALDFGTKKLGVAVGQNLTNTAMGIDVIPVHGQEPDWARLDALVQRWK